MTIFAGRSTVHRLHQTAWRNISKNHHVRHDSSKTNAPSSTNPSSSSHNTSSSGASSSNTSSPPPHPPPPPNGKSRTIPGAGWAWIDPLMRPFRTYGQMQKRSPLLTQWESALVIWYLGDLSSQVVMTNAFLEAQYEPARGLRAMLIGSISAIPGYKWFQFLGNHFNYRSHMLSIAVKVVVNQTCFTPVFNTYFFGMQTLLSGGSWADAKERVIHTVPVSWMNSWKLWPAVTAFSFTFIPPQSRNIFASVIAIGWQTYLSWLNRVHEDKHAALRQAEPGGKKVDESRERQRQPKKAKRKKADDIAKEVDG